VAHFLHLFLGDLHTSFRLLIPPGQRTSAGSYLTAAGKHEDFLSFFFFPERIAVPSKFGSTYKSVAGLFTSEFLSYSQWKNPNRRPSKCYWTVGLVFLEDNSLFSGYYSLKDHPNPPQNPPGIVFFFFTPPQWKIYYTCYTIVGDCVWAPFLS